MLTSACNYGYQLSRDYLRNGWYDYINSGEYTAEQRDVLVDALMVYTEKEFDALLPQGVQWLPATNELLYDVGNEHLVPDREEAVNLLQQATVNLFDRYEEIETEALGHLERP